jgi:hypothetical protein
MAAGLGFKTFTTGEVLSAADVNGYLMQGVLVFASAAARDAAVTSPQEGQFAYLKDTNVTTYYTGSAWANLDTTGMTNPMTTTGDTIYSSSGSTPARLGIGSTGQVLTVAAGIPSWSTPASGGGMTLITTTTWDNTVGTYTYSSLGSYKTIMFVGQNLQHSGSAANCEWNMRFNGSTASNYGQSLMQMNGTTFSGTAAANQANKIVLSVPSGSMMGASGGGANFDGDCIIEVPDYGSAQFKGAFWSGGSCQDGTRCMTVGTGHFSDSTAITSITLFMTTGNFKSGTMRVYGVS